MKVKGIIFDIDGTILDTMHIWIDAGARYLASLGIEAEEGLGEILFKMTVAMGSEYLKEKYNLPYECDEISEGINEGMRNFYRTEADFKPGAKELLDKCIELGIPMTVATSTNRDCIEPAMRRLGIWDCFDEIFCCAEHDTSKNEPMIFYKAMESMGTKPEETMLFEDGLYSIKTAAKEGIVTVGVYDKQSDSEQDEMKEIVDIYLKDLVDFDIEEYM